MGDLEQHVDRIIRHWLIREANLRRLAESAPLSQQTETRKVQCQVLLFDKMEPVPVRRRWNERNLRHYSTH